MKTASVVMIVSAARIVIAGRNVPAAATAIAVKSINAIPHVPVAINNNGGRTGLLSGFFCFVKTENLMEHIHPNHMENIPRLNRISGQIEGIKKMIEDGRYCPEIISQLRAVRAAVKAVESNILHKHLQHCVAQSFASEEDRDKKIEELKNLFDKFDE